MFKDNPIMYEVFDGPSPAPDRHPQISLVLDHQSAHLSEIEDHLSKLETRIAPIMLQRDKSQTENDSPKVSTDLVELALTISTNNVRLARAVTYIKSMISRCEL